MNRIVFLLIAVLLVSSRDARAQLGVSFGFDLEQGVDILGVPGSTVKVTGYGTLSMEEDGVNGWTSGFEIRTPDGLEFCIDPLITGTTVPRDKEILWQTQGQRAGHAPIFPDPVVFIIQDFGQPHPQCIGSPTVILPDGPRHWGSPSDPQNNG